MTTLECCFKAKSKHSLVLHLRSHLLPLLEYICILSNYYICIISHVELLQYLVVCAHCDYSACSTDSSIKSHLFFVYLKFCWEQQMRDYMHKLVGQIYKNFIKA